MDLHLFAHTLINYYVLVKKKRREINMPIMNIIMHTLSIYIGTFFWENIYINDIHSACAFLLIFGLVVRCNLFRRDDKVHRSVPENRETMSYLEKWLLEAAGRPSATGTNLPTLTPSRRQCGGSYAEDGSDSRGSNTTSPKLSSSQIPLKKRFDRTERVGSNEEGGYYDGGSESGEGSSNESDIGSDLYKNEDDRIRLAGMTELQREMILSNRATKKDDKDFKEMLRSKLDKTSSTRCTKESAPLALSCGVRSSARISNRTAAMDDALRQLREKRRKQQGSVAYLEPWDASRGRSGGQGTSSIKRKVLISASLSSSCEGKSVSESRSEDEASTGNGEMVVSNEEKVIPGSEPPTFDDIKDITIQRSKLVKWFMEPFFEDLVVGCFVRIAVGKSTSGPLYRLFMVQSVDASDPDHQYLLKGKTTNKYLFCVSGNGRITSKTNMSMVSDSTPLEKEFKQWVSEVKHSGMQMLQRRDVLEKKEALQKPNRYFYSATTVKQMLHAKKQTSSGPFNIAVEKDRLRRKLEFAESKSDKVEVERIKTKLQELEASRQSRETDTKAVKLAEMNRKNKVENLKNASEVRPLNTSLKAGDIGFDPFSRRWTRSRNYYVAKTGVEDEAAACGNVGTTEGDHDSAGQKVAGHTAMEMIAAAMDAAAGAGKLVDTGAPEDQATDFNMLHNFDLPISLAKLKEFGGPGGAHLAYMARKQRIEATVGRQVPVDDGKKHAQTLSISDYKGRRGMI